MRIKVKVKKYADGRWGFDDLSLGYKKRKRIRLDSKKEAEQKAADLTVLLNKGRPDLAQIDPVRLQRLLKLERLVENSPPFSVVREEFMPLKQKKSSRHIKDLRCNLERFEKFIGASTPLASITAQDIQSFLNSQSSGDRRKANLRSALVSLFRYGRRMNYVDRDRITEAEQVLPIEKLQGQVNVLTPEQMRILIANVKPDHLPILAIAAFAGIRTEEIFPDPKSKKDPLRWEDIDWKGGQIIIREQTSKVKRERAVPLLPNLVEFLVPWRGERGRIMLKSSRREKLRLGKLIGGWKHNALRDSFCSYRTRITQSEYQTALEMGNSVSMVRRSYNKRQDVETATEYFDIRPTAAGTKIVQFPTKKSA